MDRKTAHYLASLAARETYNKTFRKIAQSVQQGDGGRVDHVTTEYGGEYAGGHDVNTGGESREELGKAVREMNRPGGDLGGWAPENSAPFEVGKADDKDDKDGKCPKCDCDCKSKKEASSKSSLMRVAAAYASKARK